MGKTELVVMAAGMGSRYGGLKQMEPLNEFGEVILDFTVFDALKVGFDKVIFVIKREFEDLFKQKIGKRIEQYTDVQYVFQDLYDVPDMCAVPSKRIKPWGTGHALWSARNAVQGAFAMVNSDDFYGRESLKLICDYLKALEPSSNGEYAMVGYPLCNTLTDYGTVSRGVCEVENGWLTAITEKTHVKKIGGGAAYSDDYGQSWTPIDKNQPVSLNLWGFSLDFMHKLGSRFAECYPLIVRDNPLKGEFYYYAAVSKAMSDGKARVKILKTKDRWFGITYPEDKHAVALALDSMKAEGVYPARLWE